MGDDANGIGNGDRHRTYTLPQLAELSGTDYRTLHNWQKRGLVAPSHQQANGSGTTNLFGVEDALQILILAELRQAGAEMWVLETVARPLRRLVGDLGEDKVLVIGEELRIVDDTRDLERSLADSGPVLVYRPARAREALRRYETMPEAA